MAVQTPGGQAQTLTAFTFIPAPEITSFTPTQGNAGTLVTISGHNFNADNQADTVYFNGKRAKVLKATPTSLEVLAPKAVSSGIITVAGAGGKTVTNAFEVLDLSPAEAVTVYPNPTKAGITINWYKANFKVESVSIYNAIGAQVFFKDLHAVLTDELQLRLSRFGPGIYSVRLQTSEGQILKRVVVL
jgi:hypothetical protein